MDRVITLLLIAGLAGCASGHGQRHYEADHRDFERREPDEQREYWNWRHNHSR